jgi:hypothetical protein
MFRRLFPTAHCEHPLGIWNTQWVRNVCLLQPKAWFLPFIYCLFERVISNGNIIFTTVNFIVISNYHSNKTIITVDKLITLPTFIIKPTFRSESIEIKKVVHVP